LLDTVTGLGLKYISHTHKFTKRNVLMNFGLQYSTKSVTLWNQLDRNKKKLQGIECDARNNVRLVTRHYENLAAGFQQVTAAQNTTFSTQHSTSTLLLFATRVHLNHH